MKVVIPISDRVDPDDPVHREMISAAGNLSDQITAINGKPCGVILFTGQEEQDGTSLRLVQTGFDLQGLRRVLEEFLKSLPQVQ